MLKLCTCILIFADILPKENNMLMEHNLNSLVCVMYMYIQFMCTALPWLTDVLMWTDDTYVCTCMKVILKQAKILRWKQPIVIEPNELAQETFSSCTTCMHHNLFCYYNMLFQKNHGRVKSLVDGSNIITFYQHLIHAYHLMVILHTFFSVACLFSPHLAVNM